MNHRSRKILALCVTLAAAAVLVSCSTTQSAGKQFDDTAIHTEVMAKLTADRFSNIVNIDINVTNGVVTLAGEVPNAEVGAEAQREAHTVAGVTRVINNLQIKSPPTA
jgi:osmotically-inducible protein OsmY